MGNSVKPAFDDAHLAREYDLFRRSEQLRAFHKDRSAIVEECRESVGRFLIAHHQLTVLMETTRERIAQRPSGAQASSVGDSRE